ncbi:Translation machinery-associated protein 22 [Penicillium manginii]|uniref:Translation machinery-associated protein 22 n=1 Tax=Penicillium manginii TaxID=203109 RepID=UPI002549B405|nr:Translation machinery-associated protein 22 [Penicillium manginii]KAJ5742130.1 Translation machinery-associated protein 22 [Penicillium manginii]
MAEVADTPGSLEPQARHIVYCGVCTLPPEYCEFGGTAKKCEEWLEAKQPDLWTRLYSEDAVTANLSTLSLSAQERAAKDAAKKEARAAQSEARDAERKAASKIQIKRVERNKRKHVTVLVGLEVFGLENKKIAKDLGKKFATGSSMTRSAAGTEEITVQGDVSEEIREWLLEVHGDKVPKGNIELIEDKKKKKADAAAGLA